VHNTTLSSFPRLSTAELVKRESIFLLNETAQIKALGSSYRRSNHILVADRSRPWHQLLLSYFVDVSTCVMNVNVSESPLPLHCGSSDRAPSWRVVISLALSIALHAALLTLFLRPQAPAASPGGSDMVTVYLRDSRRLSPPSAPDPHIARASNLRVDARRDIVQTPIPLGRKPIASVRAATSMARHEAMPSAPARTNDRAPVTFPQTADVPRSKPSPVDQQANRAPDSSAQYMRELAARLSQVKRYPQVAVALHEEGTVLLSFQIDRAGRLLAWTIVSSSGHDDLDNEVARMIAEAAPFPPFPPSWDQSEKEFRVPIGFSLHG
jgi:TonB family protein